MRDINNKVNDNIIIGRNAVSEAIRSKRSIDTIFVSKKYDNRLADILSKAKNRGMLIKEVDTKKLDLMCSSSAHQGIVAVCAVKDYSSVDDIFNLARHKNEEPFIIILDEIEDPNNLGAIIRTAECSGVHGIIIPKRRSCGLNFTVGKASAGAVEYVPVARVPNIVAAIEDLKKRGVWIYGTDMVGNAWCQTDFKGPVALVIGSEGKGISRLVKEKCDIVISLPLCGNIQSLNASVAAGVVMYEIARQRLHIESI